MVPFTGETGKKKKKKKELKSQCYFKAVFEIRIISGCRVAIVSWRAGCAGDPSVRFRRSLAAFALQDKMQNNSGNLQAEPL